MQTTANDVVIPRKVWTRAEAHALVDAGIPNAEKLELIEGELIDHMGKKRPHVIWQQKIHSWLAGVFGSDRVEFESPNDVAQDDNVHSEPEPDLKVLKQPSQQYKENPLPSDLLLVVEISDTTVRFDLTVKARLYARAGIVEYWVLNIPKNKLIVHREPAGDEYTSVTIYDESASVAPLSAPRDFFCLNDFLN